MQAALCASTRWQAAWQLCCLPPVHDSLPCAVCPCTLQAGALPGMWLYTRCGAAIYVQ